MLKLSSSRVRGRAGHRRPRAWLSMLAVAGVLALGVPAASTAAVRAGGPQPASPAAQAMAARNYYSTTLNYVIRFRARFASWVLQRLVETTGAVNTFLAARTGPGGLLGPPVRAVPGPNVDTVYAFCNNLDLSQGPQILTIPATTSRFSVADIDVWGDVFTAVPAQPGTYALTLPRWHGTLPPGVTRVNIPYPVSTLVLRADRYSPNGTGGYVNMVAPSRAFIAGLHLASLPAYKHNPSSGATKFVPQPAFAASSKLANDRAARYTPTLYLKTLQTAMHSPTTRPLTASDAAASNSFDTVFAAAQRALRRGNPVPLVLMARAAQNVQTIIAKSFYTHTIGNSDWIYYNNIGQFGTDFLARSAIAEFALYSNVPSTATYWFAYADGCGATLNARTAYRLTFSKAQIPDAKRFWSMTAYTPPAVGLIQWPGVRPFPPSAKNVAAYSPGLVTSPNGSITIYIQRKAPANRSLYPNWLPTPASGPFALWLRVYGPTGNTALDKHYIPPPLRPVGGCGN
jgi:hypothetical protein